MPLYQVTLHPKERGAVALGTSPQSQSPGFREEGLFWRSELDSGIMDTAWSPWLSHFSKSISSFLS